MLRIGSAAAVSEEHHLSAIAQSMRDNLGSLGDAFLVFFKELGLDTQAFCDEFIDEFRRVLHFESFNSSDRGLPSTSASACPVYDFFTFATCSGVPVAITRPPCAPPSGPRSTIQSAVLITSR